MKNRHHSLLFLLALFGLLGAYPKLISANQEKTDSVPPLNSIEWQKVNLQQKIVQKVERAVGNFVKPNEFVVDVDIELSQWKAPIFAPPADPQEEEEKKKQEEEEKKKKEEEEAQKKKKEDAKKGVKFNDYKLEPVPKDYLIFQKLGLEVPLIDTFKDEVKVEEKTPINFPDIKIPPPIKPGDIERERYNALIKYNDSFDLFKNLQSITIKVWLNKNVDSNVKATIEKVVRGLALTYGEVSADVKVSYLEYAVPEVIVEEKPLEWWEWVEKFKLPIGIILAVIILGLFLYVLLSKYEKMKKEQDAANASAQTPPLAEEPEEEEQKDEAEGGGGTGSGEIEDVTKTSGIERFKSFMIHALKDAGLLVKKWIYEEKELSNLALKYIVERLEYEILLNLFGTLSDADREKWKKVLYRYPGKIPDEDAVDSYVGVEVVNQVIVTPVVDDHELSDILISIDKEVIMRFMRDKSDLAGILMNVLNTSYIQSSIEELDDEFLREVITLSLMYTKTEVRANVPLLKEELAHYVEIKQESPFIEKIRQLIPGMFRHKENHFFNALFSAGEGYIAKQIALQTFPSEVIPSLPFELLKVVIDQWNIKKQVEFLVSLEEKESKFFIELMAPEGTKRREMINLELENFQIDKNMASLISQRKDEIWLSFMDEMRSYIHDHPEIKGQIAEAIDQWGAEKEELYKEDVAQLQANIQADQQAKLAEEESDRSDDDNNDGNMAAE